MPLPKGRTRIKCIRGKTRIQWEIPREAQQ
ncbi:hypothetical protein N288_11470 [Bacillus infantis NRRL B-14911]|uniref:Uncharacterized protein n=1 Tax=Bacillus infantis NRRL B-14911 TaxID=1367477 RepID=U5LCB7_9BACI|nr:hypothetical protein N288_11470 [Bacillus infantis NRRL B-14911]